MWHRALAVSALLVAAALVAPPARGDAEPVQQAVKQGVACLKGLQAADGSWPTHHAGATALVGLTLLECDVPASDAAVQGAASYLRNAWTEINDGQTTYAISLVILFLDRLGDSSDTVIIQTLTARLLAGQSPAGGWSYRCPALGADDVRQLRKLLQQQVELKTGGQGAGPARPARDKPALPKEIRQLLTHLQKKEPAGRGEGWLARDDNSNTQFAILGLWAGHRHGVPVEKALARVETHFRTSQHSDGGWSYTSFGGRGGLGFSTPSMTCAGLLGLAMGLGNAREATLRTETKAQSGKASSAKAAVDPTRDRAIRAGLNYLGGVIGGPLDEAPERGLRGGSADMYYLLWSIERVGVAYGLPRIGNKDWYAWGSNILLAAQGQDGGWHGRFGPDIDTSFALLFLRRANLTRDLTSYLKGTPSVNVALKTGLPAGQAPEALERNDADDGENRAATRERDETKAGPLTRRSTIPPLNMDAKRGAAGSPEARGQPGVEKNSKPPGQLAPKEESVPGSAATSKAPDEAARLGADLLKASGQQQDHLLDQLKQGKGVAYTEALAAAIPQLSGAVKTKARAALTERLARMTAFTLHDKLLDDAPEIRRAAALALAMKEEKQAIPDLIALLEDREATVVRASHAALKELTGQDFGPSADAAPEARAKAIAAWKDWWKKQHAK